MYKATAVVWQLGASRSWASREANDPGTRVLIAELLAPRRERLSMLFDKTLDVIEDAFQARKIFLAKGCSWTAVGVMTRGSMRGGARRGAGPKSAAKW